MPIYVMLTNLTDEGRKTIKHNPDRIKHVNKEVTEMGARLVAQYALIGAYDFITILDAPDNKTIVKVAMNLGARGTLTSTTMATLTLDEFVGAMNE